MGVRSPSHEAGGTVAEGRYRIGPLLGAGGMAAVHHGVATGALGFARPVAIKRIDPKLATDEAFLVALEDEARIAARIRHPNVVGVLDVVLSGGELSIVLEYVHGESLGALLRDVGASRRRIPVGVAVAVVVDVLNGLHAAHVAVDEKGASLDVVHRDVSPVNVLVGADGAARVFDFGVAKAKNRVSVTRDGAVKGKILYMAPEQIGGEADARSDQYAAALVLWEMLVGDSPFADATTDSEALARALQGVKKRPGECADGIPSELDAIVMRGLSASPAARFGSAAEMARALEATGLAVSRAEVGAFVSEIASAALARRAEIVARLEREVEPTSGVTSRRALALVASGSSPSDARMEEGRPPRKRRGALLLALVVLAGALLGAWAFAARPDARADLAPAPPPAAPPPSATATPPPVETPPAPAETAATPSAPSGRASAEHATKRAPSRSARPGTNKPRTPTSSPPASTAKNVDCTVPYTVGPDGFRVYRRECFK